MTSPISSLGQCPVRSTEKCSTNFPRKVFSSISFKTFLKKIRIAGLGVKVMGSVGAVTSLFDMILEYANFYSESEALRAELNAVNVPHDRIVRIVIR
jgi:hypothetical protein